MRAVLDPNVLIAALLSRQGTPARIISGWLAGEFELILSESLLAELERALAYPRLRARIGSNAAALFISLLRDGGIVASDPADSPSRSADRGADYLIALAESQRAFLVSGDGHLLTLAHAFPIQPAHQFLDALKS